MRQGNLPLLYIAQCILTGPLKLMIEDFGVTSRRHEHKAEYPVIPSKDHQ